MQPLCEQRGGTSRDAEGALRARCGMWGIFGGLCPSLGPQGRAVQCVGGRHSSPQNPPLALLGLKIYNTKGLQLVCFFFFLLLDFAPVSASRGKFPGQLVGNGKMEEK